MMQRNSDIAKISRPRVSGILPRERLFRLLDSGRGCPVIWVAGPAGSGKTTLVASYLDSRKLPCLWYQLDEADADLASFFYYMGLAAKKAAPRKQKPLPLLTAEYLFGIPTFAKRYFEDLSSRLKPPFAMVFDNYQTVPEDSAFHEAIREGLGSIPEGISVILISRGGPHHAVARLRAGKTMKLIGWEDIRLTREEAKGLLRLHGEKGLAEDTIRQLHERTEGWAAGLVLLAERAKVGKDEMRFRSDLPPEEVFDYFAGEVLDKLDSETQDFLHMTAFLPKMTAEAAERLTDQENAGRILSDLSRNHFFTVKHSSAEPTYQYHPLFREILLTRMKESLSPGGVIRVQKRAAALLEESGQVEDAASLYLDAQDWEHLVRLILSTAQSLIVQGRSKTLEQWIADVPDDLRQDNPWLLYWLGICKMTVDLRESRKHLEKAFSMFKDRRDIPGMYLSWSGIIDTFVYEWADFMPLDRWISEIETLLRQYPEFPSYEIEARVTYGVFCALMYRQPQHSDLPQWAERAMAIALGSGDVRLRTFISSNLILYYSWWRGDTAKASLLVNNLNEHARSKDVSPLLRIGWTATASANAWLTAENERSLSLMKSGLELAQTTGVHLWDFMLLTHGSLVSLNLGDLVSAEEYLSRMAFITQTTRKGDIYTYWWQMGCKLLCEENFPIALEHLQTGLRIARESGFPMGIGAMLYGVVEVFIELGDYATARKHLEEASRIAVSLKSGTLEYQHLWLEALYHIRLGERDKALAALRRHLAVSRETGISNHQQWRSKTMGELYVLALEERIEVEHVQKMIRLHNMVPTESQAYIANWPWPLKIYTLGQFKIEKDGKPVTFSGKVQKKPLDLLKALVSLGGKDVSEEQLVDALWPDADGDQGHRSFETTLYRLRQLLSSDKALTLIDGTLSIDARYCWIDILAFERSMADAESARREEKDGKGRTPMEHLERAISLYRGHFLPADASQSFTVSMRERLRVKFHRLVTDLGSELEGAGKWKEAVAIFHRGLEIDDLAEEFYQHLMICSIERGQQAEAVSIYNHCCSALSASMGLEPSSKTQEIYQSLITNQGKKIS